MALGRRQKDVLEAAAQGKSWTHHSGQGRMTVAGLQDTYGDDVLDRLLDLGLVQLGPEWISGHEVQLTDAGREALTPG